MNELKIEKLDHQGRGIAFLDGKVTFLKNALPNEIVLCKIIHSSKNYNIGEVVEYKKKSESRTKAFCPYYNLCGGCDLEHMTYEDSIRFKKEKVENILRNSKVEFPKIEIIKNENPKEYRNKLSLKVKKGTIGFYEEKSHSLIEIETCPLAKKSINDCLKKLKTLKIQNGAITVRSNWNEEVLLIIQTNDQIDFKIENFSNVKIVGVVQNGETIYGNNFFYERINGFLFKVSYDAFFQINPYVTPKLFSCVINCIKKDNVVLDLFSGVGTLSLLASKSAKKVYSIEIVQNAVLNHLENIKLNHITNCFPILGDAFKVISKIEKDYDTIVVDPPRKGLSEETCQFLLKSDVKKIVYVSCNPMTLVRDLKGLVTAYKIEKFYLLDMFSFTHHVECVCVLERR